MDLKKIVKIALFVTLAIPPLVLTKSLIFPFVSGRIYIFRLFVEISFFLWFILLLKNSKYRPDFKNIVVASTLLILLGFAVTGLLGVDPVHSFFGDFERGKGVIQFAHWVLYFLMLISVLKDRKDWKVIFSIFLAIAFITSAYAWSKYQERPRLFGLFGNSAYLGGFMIFAIGYVGVVLERKFFGREVWKTAAFSLLALFFLVTLVFTQTRGSYAGLGAGFVLLTLLSILFLRKEKKKATLVLGSILLILLLSAGALFAFRGSDFVQGNHILKRTAEASELWESDSFKDRLVNWRTAFSALKDRPVFGWGMENFQMAFNKYYDYKVGVHEPWFDRVHNQSLQYLADGGIFLFSLYLFWIFSIYYLIFKIFKKEKLLGIILASIVLAYIVQGLFLFDIFPLYMGFFVLIGFVYFQYKQRYVPEEEMENGENILRSWKKFALFLMACFIAFSVYYTVWLPYRANNLTWKFFAYSTDQEYGKSKKVLKEAFEINSSFGFLPSRKRAGWQLLGIMIGVFDEKMGPKAKKDIEDLYEIVTSELEKVAEKRPYDPQVYYLLGKLYRLGSEKLERNDLDKAETILKKSFDYSELRVEYYNELGLALLEQGKFEEAEKLIKGYTEKVGPDNPFPAVSLGHLYFLHKDYDLAMDQYRKAEEKGHDFHNPIEYSRYLATAEETENWQKIINLSLQNLERKGPNAQAYFNIALSYRKLDNLDEAKDYFDKAVNLDDGLQEYAPFFLRDLNFDDN